MEFKLKLALSILFVLVNAFGGEGLRIDGENFHADSDTQLVFMDRFVFQPNGKGLLDYDITIAANFCCPDIVIFSGWSSQWPAVRDQLYEMSCYDMIERATATIPLWGNAGTCDTFLDTTGVENFRCKGQKSFQYPKDQWYYITVMNCHYKQDPGIEILDYQLHFVNDYEGLTKEFSADESTNLPVSLIFTILLSFLFSVGFIFGVQLAHKKMLHVTYQLWIVSLLLHTIGILVLAWGWFRFALDGIRKDETELAGHILKAVGTVVFASIMVLISKGYTITRLTMRDIGKLKLAFFVIGFAVSHVTLYIIQHNADPKVVTNIYDTPAALGLVVIRFIGTAWSLYGVFFTMKDYPSKHAFYAVFIIFVICWFMAEPTVAFLSTFCLPLYCRAKFVFGFDVAAITLGHFIFIWLVRPASTNQFFPFHLKTNKVDFDFLYDTDPRNNYKPSKETFDLFVTKRDDPEEGNSSAAKEIQKKGMDKLTADSKPTMDNIFMTRGKGSKKDSTKLPTISTTIPLERMINCSVDEPPKNLPDQYLEDEVTYTPVEDLRLTNSLEKYELQPSYQNEVNYSPVEDLRVNVTRKNHNYKHQLSEQNQYREMTTAMKHDHDNVLSSSGGEESRLNQDKHHSLSRKNKVQTTTCGERFQIAQDLLNLSGQRNPGLKVDSALQDTESQNQHTEMTTAMKHDHDNVRSSSGGEESRLNQDKPHRRSRKNKVQTTTCGERLQIAQDLRNLSGQRNPGLKVDSAQQDTESRNQHTEMTTAMKHDHDNVRSSSGGEESRLNQDKPHRRSRKNKVQTTTCGERLQIAQDLRNLSGQRNPGLKVDSAQQDTESRNSHTEMTTAMKHDHDNVLSSSGGEESRLNQDKHHRRSRKNKVQTTTCGERLQIAQDLRNLSGQRNPGLKVDSALQDTESRNQHTEMTTAMKHDHDNVLSSCGGEESRLNQDKPHRRLKKNKVQTTTCGERLQITQDLRNLSGQRNPGLNVDSALQDTELRTQKFEGKLFRPPFEFRMENEEKSYWAQRRGQQHTAHVTEPRTDNKLEQPSVCSSDDEMDAKRRRIMELRAALEKEEMEYQMTLAEATSQESVNSFESDIDAEKGDTDVIAKKKNKKRRNPIHKATKILGMKKKKNSSEQQ